MSKALEFMLLWASDMLFARVLVEYWYAHCQADEGMAIEVRPAIMLGVVVQDARTHKEFYLPGRPLFQSNPVIFLS